MRIVTSSLLLLLLVLLLDDQVVHGGHLVHTYYKCQHPQFASSPECINRQPLSDRRTGPGQPQYYGGCTATSFTRSTAVASAIVMTAWRRYATT